ncbi:MAG TPA: multidrug ABC transporter ATP-binding protein [Clostridium sp.]|nr:multidrug ABC transporter ATP-binding protein [Clostridium sp.]
MRKYLFRHKGLFVITAIMAILVRTIDVCIAFIFKYITDVAQAGDIEGYKIIVIVMVGYFILNSSMSIIGKNVQHYYIKKTMIFLKMDIFSNILKKDIKDFNGDNSGKYISMLSSDVSLIENDYFTNIFEIIRVIFGFILAVVSMVTLSIEITISVFLLGVLSFLLPQIFGEKLSKYRSEYSSSQGVFISKVKDILLGFDVIKSFNVENKMIEEYSKYNNDAESKKNKFNIFETLVGGIAIFMAYGIFTVVFGIGSYLCIKGKITIGTMFACVQLSNNVTQPIMMSIQYINKIKSLKEISAKIEKLSEDTGEDKLLIEKTQFNKEIAFDNISFSYDKERKILNSINLCFKKGKKYAIVGASGGGKSTILKLLLKYYENYSGNILVDGTELKNISSENLYKLEGIIQQNVFIFDASLKDNITLFGSYSNSEINRAIEISGLNPLLIRLKDGLNSELGENGNLLSGGEKQRISIARAVIKNTPIMLLDEATSSLDNETAYAIEKTLVAMKDITSVVVTHRLWGDILKEYDEIIVIKNGEIVEQGNFYELLQLKRYFYGLYYISQGEYEEKEII